MCASKPIVCQQCISEFLHTSKFVRFDRPVSKKTKSHIAHTRVYTVCLTELSLNFFPQKYISFVYIILHCNMEDYNLVIPMCMLIKAAAYYNVLVSDGANSKNSFSLSPNIVSMLNPQLQNPSFIDTETQHVIFFYVYYLCLKDYRNPGKIVYVALCCL